MISTSFEFYRKIPYAQEMQLHSTLELETLQASISAPPIVYFCAEFAVDSTLPIYAGGLGILAGDVLGQAADEHRPMLGIGLYYHHGYLRQAISKEANIHEGETIDPVVAGLSLLVHKGKPLTVTVTIHAREVKIHTYVKMVGSVPLLLLDTDVDGNEAQDSSLCDRLYYGDKEHRFKQEMILGIGGMRVFRALGIKERLFHLNEGHSALMLFEHVRSTVATTHASVTTALESITDVVFTNHTLVPAGNDVFSKDLVISYLASYALDFPIDPSILVKYGLIQDTSLFSPTMLALRLSTHTQAVSHLHAKKALEVWPDHPLVPVTNGVRASYWQTPQIRDHLDQDDAALWEAHRERKKILIDYTHQLTGFSWDPGDLVIGWARRLANYKRPLLLFEDLTRLRSIMSSSSVPVHIVLSGKPHAHDEAAQENLRKILEIVGTFGGSIVYLQNYNLDVARILLSGVDVLLNTPVRGLEACGTSGMKASMNGVLQWTTLDGWTDEVDWDEMGWVIPDENSGVAVLDILEHEILPTYAKRDASGIPCEWVARMRKTVAMSTSRYSAARMLHELEQQLYSLIDTERSA